MLVERDIFIPNSAEDVPAELDIVEHQRYGGTYMITKFHPKTGDEINITATDDEDGLEGFNTFMRAGEHRLYISYDASRAVAKNVNYELRQHTMVEGVNPNAHDTNMEIFSSVYAEEDDEAFYPSVPIITGAESGVRVKVTPETDAEWLAQNKNGWSIDDRIRTLSLLSDLLRDYPLLDYVDPRVSKDRVKLGVFLEQIKQHALISLPAEFNLFSQEEKDGLARYVLVTAPSALLTQYYASLDKRMGYQVDFAFDERDRDNVAFAVSDFENSKSFHRARGKLGDTFTYTDGSRTFKLDRKGPSKRENLVITVEKFPLKAPVYQATAPEIFERNRVELMIMLPLPGLINTVFEATRPHVIHYTEG